MKGRDKAGTDIFHTPLRRSSGPYRRNVGVSDDLIDVRIRNYGFTQ